ncbi:MAG: ABC transporter ATP-binding protein [Burkholderiales bacterium]|nr:ABC transporter ATP-binding protein [Burkholderiales bacterium]
MLLDVKNLHAYYDSSHVLKGISLSIQARETIGLLGKNGMGKSTLIRSILGLVHQRQGEIYIQEKTAMTLAPYEIARLGIAYVPEGRGIFPNLSVKENLIMAARPNLFGQTEWTLDKILGTFPALKERLNHLGEQISGGEQQMLSIGRALMTHPQLLILDEATEGLAPLVVAQIWQVIAQIKARGIATLIVDRDWRKVLQHSDRAVVLLKGEIVLEGTGIELLHHPDLSTYLGV